MYNAFHLVFPQQVSEVLNHEARQSLPAAGALGKTIRRKRASLFPPEPPNLASLMITDPFDKIDGERDFVQLDDTAPDGTRVIVFATEESLGHLSQVNVSACKYMAC